MPIAERIAQVQAEIAAAAARVGREPATVQLIAVSKGQPAEKIREAITAGQTAFGENYAQELTSKAVSLATEVTWHFLGHLQRNKVKGVVPHVTWIHSVDSAALVETLQAKAVKPIACCIEVNLAGERAKTGVAAENVAALINAFTKAPRLTLNGLMCLPPPNPDPEASRPYFRQLAILLKELNQRAIYPHPLTDLSMGMTNDFDVAIQEGATMVRIGTGIFGERT